jgi:hypothetical protein
VVEEVDLQASRDRERPQAVPDLLDDFLGEEGAEERAALSRAGRAEAAPFGPLGSAPGSTRTSLLPFCSFRELQPR